MIISYDMYSKERMKVIRSHIMKQNADLQEGISQAYSTAIPLLTLKSLTNTENFQMRYYKRIFIKGHQYGQRVKFQTSNFT